MRGLKAGSGWTWGGGVRVAGALRGAALLLLAACGGSDDAFDLSDTRADVAGADSVAPADTSAADTASPADTQSADASADTTEPDTAQDVHWPVEPASAWMLARPLAVASSDGAGVTLGAPVLAGPRRAYVPVRLGSGALVADGRSFPAPDAYAHAAVLLVEAAEDGSARVVRAVYVDGALDSPEVPRVVLCEGVPGGGEKLYVSVNDSGGQASRLLELSPDLESVRSASVSAVPNLGTSVRLGAPVCAGPGLVVTLDALGGAVFVDYNNRSSQFSAEQTVNRTLILNGAKVFGSPPGAQTVSATGMRIIHLARNAGQRLLYVGEATIERALGESTTLVPGDQLVYQHDFSTATGGTIASQGFFGRQDITAIAGSGDGRFAVAWLDVAQGAAGEAVEVVVTVFSEQGARLWTRRAAAWAVDGLAFGEDGDLRVVGRFRSLEHLGVAPGPEGTEDAFLVVLDGETGERVRHVTRGWGGLASAPVGGPTRVGAACGEGPADAMVVRSEGVWEVVSVRGDEAQGYGRCVSAPLQAGRAELMWATAETEDGLWAWAVAPTLPDGLDGGDLAWPSGLGTIGALRARLDRPL